MIKKTATIPSCLPNTTNVEYVWKQVSGPENVEYVISSTNLAILNFETQVPSTYVFEVYAYLNNMNSSSKATFTLTTMLQPLSIESGIESISFDNINIYFLVSDNSNTLEDEKWTFNCSSVDGLCGQDLHSFLQQQADLNNPSFSVDRSIVNPAILSGTITIQLFVIKGLRSITSELMISFPPSLLSVPPVILPLIVSPPRLNPTDCIYLLFMVTVNGDRHATFSTRWTLDGEHLDLINTTTTFQKCDLEEGKSYQLVFFANSNNVESKYIYETTVNRLPNCLCSVSPTSGVSLETQFTLDCPNCQNAEHSYELSFGMQDSFTGVEVVLSKNGENSFTFELPTPKSDSCNVFILIENVLTGASSKKTFSVELSKPTSNSLSEMASKVDIWMTESSKIQDGDPRQYVFNSVSIANTIKYLLDSFQTQQNTRALRVIECSGHGHMSNGYCVCDANYLTKDCKFNTEDFVVIQKIKNNLFNDFKIKQISRNTSIESISESILVQTIQGIESFITDIDFYSNNTVSDLLKFLENVLFEAYNKKMFSFNKQIANSLKKTLFDIELVSNMDKNYLLSLYEKISSTYLRGKVGDYLFFNSTFSQSVTFNDASKAMDGSTLSVWKGVNIKLPPDVSSKIPSTSMTHTLTLISDFSNTNLEQGSSIISSYAVKWGVDGTELKNLTNRIIYELPLARPLVRNYHLRSLNTDYSYSCQYMDENGQYQQDSTCIIQISNSNTASCYCNRQATVIVVESVKNISLSANLVKNASTCNSIRIEAIAECNIQTEFTFNWFLIDTNVPYLRNLISNTNSMGINRIEIDYLQIPYGNYSVGVNVSSSSGQYTVNITSFEVKQISLELNLLEGVEIPVNISLKTVVTPQVVLSSCLKGISLWYSYEIKENSVENNVKLYVDNSTGCLIIGKEFTVLPKEGTYFIKLTVGGFNIKESSIDFLLTTVVDPLIVKFNTTDRIQSVGELMSFKVVKDDPSSFQDSELLNIICLNEKGLPCPGIERNLIQPIYSNFNPSIGYYKFIAIYTKGLRSTNNSLTIIVGSILGYNSNNGELLDLNNIDQMMELSFTIYLNAHNPSYYWSTDIGISSTSNYLNITRGNLLSSKPNINYYIKLTVRENSTPTIQGELNTVFKLKMPTQTNEHTLSTLLNNNETVSSMYVLNVLNLISSYNGTGDILSAYTTSMVSKYLDYISTTNTTTESTQSEVSALHSISFVLKNIEDTIVSQIISKLDSLVSMVASDFSNIVLGNDYLDDIKRIADNLSSHINMKRTIQFSTIQREYIQNIYLNLVRAYVKKSNPDDKAKILEGAGAIFYSRKILLSSIKNGLLSFESFDKNKNYFGILNGFYENLNVEIVTITVKTQPSINLPHDSSTLFVSDIVDFMVDGILLNSSSNPIANIMFRSDSEVLEKVDCLVFNNLTSRYETNLFYNVVNVGNRTLSVNILKPGTIVLSVNQLDNNIITILPLPYANLSLLGLLVLVVFVCIIGVILVSILIVCIKRKLTKKAQPSPAV